MEVELTSRFLLIPPAMSPSDPPDLFQNLDSPEETGFAALSRNERDILILVATREGGSSQSHVLQKLSLTELSNKTGRRFTGMDLKKGFSALEERNLIENSHEGWRVPASLRTWAFYEALATPDYAPRATDILRSALIEKRRNHFGHYYYRQEADQIKLEIMLYLGQVEEAWQLIEEKMSYDSDFSLQFLVSDFPPEDFRRLPDLMRYLAVVEFLGEAPTKMENPFPGFEAMTSIDDIDPPLIMLSATLLFLSGDESGIREAARLLRERKVIDPEAKRECEADARALEAWLEFAKGNLAGAIAGFEESFRIEQGPTRRRKFYPRQIGGLLYQLALCLRGEPGDFERIYQIHRWMTEDNASIFSGKDGIVISIADCLNGKRKAMSEMAHTIQARFLENRPDLRTLLFAIFLRLCGAKEGTLRDWAAKADELAEAAYLAGYRWIAMEATAFTCLVDDSPAHRKRFEEIHDSLELEGATPFSNRFDPPEDWESPLMTVEAIARKFGKLEESGTARKEAAPKRKEFFWRLILPTRSRRPRAAELPPEPEDAPDDSWDDYDYDSYDGDDATFSGFHFQITPMERTVSRTGRATKGRKISLKRLKEKPDEIESLSEQDRRVLSYIVMERNWSGREVYYLSNPRCLLDLVGHPLLFSDDGGNHPVTLKKGRIRIDVTESDGDQIRVKMVPSIKPGGHAVELTREGPGSYTIYEISGAVAELAEAFEGEAELTLPARVKGRFMNAISALATDLEIGAEEGLLDGSTESAPFLQVQGDATPRLRLVPQGSGLQANFLVRPMATSEFTFVPGEGKSMIFGFSGEERVQATRDLEAEKTAALAVVQQCPALANHQGESPRPWEWIYDTPLAALELLRDLHDFQKATGSETPQVVLEWPEGESIRLRGSVSAANTTLTLGGNGDWLTLSGDVTVDENLVFSMRKLLELSAASERSGFIEIGEGKFLALTEGFQRQIEDLRVLSQPGKGETLKLPPLAAIALEDFVGEAQHAKTRTKGSKCWSEWIERFREARDHSPPAPPTLKADLRPYQLEGYRWLSRLARTGAGACLADDMGLGKTVQTLALLLERSGLGPSLVVAPTSVAANWLDETLKFAPTLRPLVFGEGDRSALLAEVSAGDLVICTYGLLQREKEALAAVEWNVIVLDEAQAIKNSTTLRSRAARSLKGSFRLVTTGTPVENRLSELHTLFQFILPGFFGSWERFRKQFADPIERHQSVAVRNHLRRLVHPFLLRRLKSTVLKDLPERTEINLHVDLSDEETAFYEALRLRAVEQLARPGKENGTIQILAELMRLRRACCHPVLVDSLAGANLSSSKLASFLETLEEILAGGHKVLVFSQFVDHLTLIRKELDERKITYQYLDGATTKPKRKAAVDAFQRGIGEVFLISLKAGGFGLNLTAADYVIHMDPWWNPAAEDQASDRAHRIGQTRPVTIYRFITRNTIEEKIVDLHHRKRELAESLLSGADQADTRLSPEDLLALIRD